jgi:23S rRNA (adenine-N6)-dimethyltransferase
VSAEERTRWGYHQLSDHWAARLVNAAPVSRGDLVVDVGAGRGAVTARLVEVGARVIAVELHPDRARRLRQRFGPTVVVVQVDAADLRLPRREFRVVANPPFGITAALLRRLLSPGSRMLSADLIVPANTAARWAAGRGRGAAQWSGTYRASVVDRFPVTAFRPPSPMATAVLRLELRSFRVPTPTRSTKHPWRRPTTSGR